MLTDFHPFPQISFLMEATNNNIPSNSEEGVEELLDSCLDDFNRPIPKPVPSSPQSNTASTSTTKKDSNDSSADVKLPEANWGEEFKQFQDVMENFLENESELNELKNLMSNFNENGVEALDKTFLDTIKGLTEGAQNIPEMSPEELAGMFGNFDLNEPGQVDTDQLPELMPLMHNVMQRLMSKELLYPSIKEIVEKYPGWLSEKKTSLKPEDYERYSQQYNLMKSVCDEFERENVDSEEAKKQRFEKVLMLMQKIQNYGNPPKELVADIGQNVPLDEHGNLQIPGMPQQCSIM